MAHLLQCPVYLFFCFRDRQGYHVHMEPFADRLDLPRRGREEAIKAWVARYAAALEARCRETPFQWFNFYDFWGATRADPISPPASLPPEPLAHP